MARLSERAKAAGLRDRADRIDYEAAFGADAWHASETPAAVRPPPFAWHKPLCLPPAAKMGLIAEF
jgi:hypothetical protein